jgi:hypothetical protein
VNLSTETCRVELKRLINEKIVASCWLFTSLYENDARTPKHQTVLLRAVRNPNYIPISLNRSEADSKTLQDDTQPHLLASFFLKRTAINAVIFPTSNYSSILDQFLYCIILALSFPSNGEMVGVVSVGVFGHIFSYVRGI